MPQKPLVKHGTRAGYDAELAAGGPENVCDRCRAAKRVYQKQYTKIGKAKGLHYGAHDVIDHLDTMRQQSSAPRQSTPYGSAQTADRQPTDEGAHTADSAGSASDTPPQSQAGPSVADRIGDALRGFVGQRPDNSYVDSDAPPDYISAGDPDPEPEGDWSQPSNDDYVITKESLTLIEDNLGTYLSVIGITLEMIDPYCGPILAENFGNIVGRWTKVIARYPKAAKLFMSKDGGTLFLWIGALQATWPVLLAIYEHHLAHSIQTDKQGRVFRVTNPSANGHPADVDATMPGQSFNYTVD